MEMRGMVLVAALSLAGFLQAQEGPSPKIGPGTLVEPSKSFDGTLTGLEKELMGAARAMPADKYSFAPGAALFAAGSPENFKGGRTFAQQLTHIAEANYYYGSMLGGLKVDADMKAIDKLTDKEQILAALQASFVFAHKALANLTATNAFESIHETDTRASLAGGLVAHGFDHYGQLVEYLRMNGMVPPASAK